MISCQVTLRWWIYRKRLLTLKCGRVAGFLLLFPLLFFSFWNLSETKATFIIAGHFIIDSCWFNKLFRRQFLPEIHLPLYHNWRSFINFDVWTYCLRGRAVFSIFSWRYIGWLPFHQGFFRVFWTWLQFKIIKVHFYTVLIYVDSQADIIFIRS